MNETEFLDLLRYYFRNAKTEEVEEILADYESHFEEGKKRGLSEEEIARELGSPKDIYNSFQSEGVVDEKAKGSPLKSRALDMAKDAQDKMGKTWDAVSPRLPGAAEATARMTARLLTAAGIIMAIVVLAAAGLVIGLFSTFAQQAASTYLSVSAPWWVYAVIAVATPASLETEVHYA